MKMLRLLLAQALMAETIKPEAMIVEPNIYDDIPNRGLTIKRHNQVHTIRKYGLNRCAPSAPNSQRKLRKAARQEPRGKYAKQLKRK